MRLLLVVPLFCFGVLALAEVPKLSCKVVTEQGEETGKKLLFGPERAFLVGPEGVESTIFEHDHLCGVKNDLSGSTLEHIFVNPAEDSRFKINILGDTHILRPGYPQLLGRSYELIYGKRENDGQFGWFACGIYPDLTAVRLILKDCEEI